MIVALDDTLHRVVAGLWDEGTHYVIWASFSTSRLRWRQLGVAATAILRQLAGDFPRPGTIEWWVSDRRRRVGRIRFRTHTPEAAVWLRDEREPCDVSLFHEPYCIRDASRRATTRGRRTQ